MAESLINDYVKTLPKKEDPTPANNEDISAKRESLAILATIGNTKEFLGVNMSLGVVHNLSEKDVKKYYVRYQAVMGQQLIDELIDSGIQAVSKTTAYFVSVDDSEKLYNTWRNNRLLVRDLNTIEGYLALKGGRIVTLASVTFDLTKHVRLQQKDNTFQEVLSTPEKPPEINLEDL
mgnify:CR=1 FL=1